MQPSGRFSPQPSVFILCVRQRGAARTPTAIIRRIQNMLSHNLLSILLPPSSSYHRWSDATSLHMISSLLAVPLILSSTPFQTSLRLTLLYYPCHRSLYTPSHICFGHLHPHLHSCLHLHIYSTSHLHVHPHHHWHPDLLLISSSSPLSTLLFHQAKLRGTRSSSSTTFTPVLVSIFVSYPSTGHRHSCSHSIHTYTRAC